MDNLQNNVPTSSFVSSTQLPKINNHRSQRRITGKKRMRKDYNLLKKDGTHNIQETPLSFSINKADKKIDCKKKYKSELGLSSIKLPNEQDFIQFQKDRELALQLQEEEFSTTDELHSEYINPKSTFGLELDNPTCNSLHHNESVTYSWLEHNTTGFQPPWSKSNFDERFVTKTLKKITKN